MKILSIDVGIKNLAFCLFDGANNNHKIIKWDVVNLSQKKDIKCDALEKNTPCGKTAKFTKDNLCYCLKHSKKQQAFQIPTTDLKHTFIKKQKLQELIELADKYNIKYDNLKKPIKKAELTTIINEHICNNYFDSIDSINASKVDLITIGRNIRIKLDDILDEHISTIDIVIIENQISPIANRMKTIQGMIAQYFIMKNGKIAIEFVSAANKLKDCNVDLKTKYSDRKKLGIQQCLEIMSYYSEWEAFFKTHNKKDDLADSFLQGIWFINNKIKTM